MAQDSIRQVAEVQNLIYLGYGEMKIMVWRRRLEM